VTTDSIDHVGNGVEYLIKGGAYGTTQSTTILDLTSESNASILRQGDITPEELNEVDDIFHEYSQDE
jgi:L-threonylcarbamoyladenylate synthase